MSVSDSVAPLVRAMRAVTDLPLAVGFGIANADQAAQVGSVADAVAVGSAMVRIIEKNAGDPALEQRLSSSRANCEAAWSVARDEPDHDLRRSAQRLNECRERIDAIDLRLLQLLNDRTAVVEVIGRIKEQFNMPVYEPKREDAVYRNVLDNNHGPLPPEAVKRIFERVIDEMRTLQKMRMQK